MSGCPQFNSQEMALGAAEKAVGGGNRTFERRSAAGPHSIKEKGGPERVSSMVGGGTNGIGGNLGNGTGYSVRRLTIGGESIPLFPHRLTWPSVRATGNPLHDIVTIPLLLSLRNRANIGGINPKSVTDFTDSLRVLLAGKGGDLSACGHRPDVIIDLLFR